MAVECNQNVGDLVLEYQPCADRAVEGADLLEQRGRILTGEIGVEHDVAEVAGGLQILRGDVDVALEEDLVQPPQHARYVAMDMAEARAGGTQMQLHLREVH